MLGGHLGKDDSAFTRDGSHARFVADDANLNPCSAIFRMPRVQYIDRNSKFNRRLERLGMQHFGPKMGQLSGFFEADGIDVLSVWTDARVTGHHAIDVGPDLDTLDV